MKKFLLILMMCHFTLICYGQFYSDEVLVYVKAGEDPSKAAEGQVHVIAYYSYDNQIREMSSAAYRIRKTQNEHPEYFNSPKNIPQTSNCLSSSSYGIKRYSYNSEASTSKYTVFTGHVNASNSPWGNSPAKTINIAFSKDKQQMIIWTAGQENSRITYLLTDLSKFSPNSIKADSYDFLE